MRWRFAILTAWLLLAPDTEAAPLRFTFGEGPHQAQGSTRVTADDVYSSGRGFGFADTAGLTFSGAACVSDKPFHFDVDLPEGNYRVTVTLGAARGESNTTVKAESRRLMLEAVTTGSGERETRVFTVNVRRPEIAGGGRVTLTSREAGPPPSGSWDGKLTLEFNGRRPAVAALEIAPIDDVLTVYLAGDSTVTDQSHEPYAGWGQMLPRFFRPDVVIANHAESGLALRSFRNQHRLEKILSTLRPGDYVIVQFGHNDQKEKEPGAGPFTTYKERLKKFVTDVRDKRGMPVIVTSMERRRWTGDGQQITTLHDFAEAARQVGREENVPVIDLNAMSLKLYAALGPEASKRALVHVPAGTFPGQAKALSDDTHHSAYGGYELAKCVVEGIKTHVPALAKHLLGDTPAFDPSQPDAIERFAVPASPLTRTEKPAGN